MQRDRSGVVSLYEDIRRRRHTLRGKSSASASSVRYALWLHFLVVPPPPFPPPVRTRVTHLAIRRRDGPLPPRVAAVDNPRAFVRDTEQPCLQRHSYHFFSSTLICLLCSNDFANNDDRRERSISQSSEDEPYRDNCQRKQSPYCTQTATVDESVPNTSMAHSVPSSSTVHPVHSISQLLAITARIYLATREGQTVSRRRTKHEDLKRSNTQNYYLPKEDAKFRRFIENLRSSLAKVTAQGILFPGGRHQHLRLKVKDMRNSVEYHYFQTSSSREYLFADPTVIKMYDLYVHQRKKLANPLPVTISIAGCSDLWTCRFAIRRRAIVACVPHTEKAKTKSKENPAKVACVVFDLQQVIQLPISNKSTLFYRPRLSAYNLTVCNNGNKECHCFMWHEAISKMGSCERSSCVGIYLKELDPKGIEEIHIFADGCNCQNKNVIVNAMLLYIVSRFTEAPRDMCVTERGNEEIHVSTKLLQSRLQTIINCPGQFTLGILLSSSPRSVTHLSHGTSSKWRIVHASSHRAHWVWDEVGGAAVVGTSRPRHDDRAAAADICRTRVYGRREERGQLSSPWEHVGRLARINELRAQPDVTAIKLARPFLRSRRDLRSRTAPVLARGPAE
ncbi:hypothetical protein PR048_014282 [Dryococelus australis]|uniref:Uncharacterized protein n=1 Tax=Dryococelus australis TaxID=614101 RepID=A0ABQ9HE00_9NEOP|nr:hypothetical protein PR048_014282 [Dryococelus australis]